MSQLIVTAFMMGMLGSFHCVGMCGPIALSLPLRDDSDWAKFAGALLYNAGRILTYMAFGVLFGLIGKSVAFFGYQQWLSVFLGMVILFFLVIPKRFAAFGRSNLLVKFLTKLRGSLGRLFLRKNYSSLFSVGLLNGLLPCGLVYMASAVAVATGEVAKSMLFMAFFGMGTVPMMWSIAFFGNYINLGIRQKIRKAYPYLAMMMACLLILRGMGLGIPYVSPRVIAEKQEINCCPRPEVSLPSGQHPFPRLGFR